MDKEKETLDLNLGDIVRLQEGWGIPRMRLTLECTIFEDKEGHRQPHFSLVSTESVDISDEEREYWRNSGEPKRIVEFVG